LTGGLFIYCSVRTLSAILDVVIDTTLLPRAPSVGHLVSGSFWLSGQVQHLTSEATFISRLRQKVMAG
jgi:hypothetical protein